MQNCRFLKHIGVSVIGASIATGTVHAAPVMAKQQSPHFNAVTSQLEMGGLSFSYSDQASKNGLYRGMIDTAVAYLDAHTEYRGVNAQKLTDLFTLDAVKASGSSASQRDGFVHYRTFNYMPEEKSMYSLAYGDSKPSVGLQLAPAGADLVLEMHINAAYDPDAERKMYDALGPLGAMMKQLQTEQAKNPMVAQWTELSKTINSRVVFVGDISPKGFKGIEGFPVSGELLISVTNAENIWKVAKPLLAEQGMAAATVGDVDAIVSPIEMAGWKPCLQYNAKTKQMYVSTSQEYMALCQKVARGEAPSLAKDKEFFKIKEDLPVSFSSMVYVSPQFAQTALNLVEAFGVPQVEDEEFVLPAVKMLLDKLKASAVTKTGTIYVSSVQDKGTLHVVNSPVNYPELEGSTATISAVGVATSTLFVGAKYYRDSANKAACVMNLSSMQKATRAVENLNDHKTGDPLKWEFLVGPNGPFAVNKPICPDGGTYILSPIFPKQGEAAVRCSCEDHAPDSTQGW